MESAPGSQDAARVLVVEDEPGIAALIAYRRRNSITARLVCQRDEKVDNLRRSLFRILLTHMMEEPRRITPALELLLISQNLEHIADLSTNIAEDVVFMVEGQTIQAPRRELEGRGRRGAAPARGVPGTLRSRLARPPPGGLRGSRVARSHR